MVAFLLRCLVTTASSQGCSDFHFQNDPQDRLYEEGVQEAAGCVYDMALWMTNVSNERGEVIISVLTVRECCCSAAHG